MAKMIIKMGEGLESNCRLSGVAVEAGSVVEMSAGDAQYVRSAGLGRNANAEEVAEFLKANGRTPKQKPEAPKVEKEKGPKANPKEEKAAEKPEKETPKQKKSGLAGKSFKELKDMADNLGLEFKEKGRVTKAILVDAITKANKAK